MIKQENSYISDIRVLLSSKNYKQVFPILHKYLESIGKTNYEFLINDLINLELLEKNPTFVYSMSVLDSVSKDEYQFAITKFTNEFHKSLTKNRLKDASIYLDIIKKGANIISISPQKISELEKKLNTYIRKSIYKMEIPRIVKDATACVYATKRPILIKTLSNKNVKRLLHNIPNIYYLTFLIEYEEYLLINYHALYENMNIKEKIENLKELFHHQKYEECIKVGFEIISHIERPLDVAYGLVGLSYLNLGNKKKAYLYLKIATYISSSNYNFKHILKEIEEQESDINNLKLIRHI